MTAPPLFPVLDVIAPQDRDEPIGSKAKFWFRDPGDGTLWLFKQARERTGEDWAEKVAAEVAGLLRLPHARVELALHHGVVGIATQDFTRDLALGGLIHGNELLFALDPKYPRASGYRVREHTIDTIRAALELPFVRLADAEWPDNVSTPWAGFVGYLLLDALVGNTDRHHQNWGVLVPKDFATGGDHLLLAPTFDHASSLGRELDDATRTKCCTTRDQRGDVQAYAARARSAIYDGVRGKPLGPVEAFVAAARRVPGVGRAWLDRLAALPGTAGEEIIARVPGPTMSDPARKFAVALLTVNLQRLEGANV